MCWVRAVGARAQSRSSRRDPRHNRKFRQCPAHHAAFIILSMRRNLKCTALQRFEFNTPTDELMKHALGSEYTRASPFYVSKKSQTNLIGPLSVLHIIQHPLPVVTTHSLATSEVSYSSFLRSGYAGACAASVCPNTFPSRPVPDDTCRIRKSWMGHGALYIKPPNTYKMDG
jgi:hypothetical protein